MQSAPFPPAMPPANRKETVAELGTLLPPAQILSEPEDLIPYSFDVTATLLQMPLAVALPRTTEEVVSLVNWSRREKVPIIPRGTGTGLAGGWEVGVSPSNITALEVG